MVAAECHVEHSERLYHVAVRKNGLDADSPWWQRWYFRFIWRPFLRFSFKAFQIPAPHKMNADGSFTFLEGVGIATNLECADAMCKDECYRVAALPVNVGLPRESIQYEPHTYPRSRIPDRYKRRAFTYAATPTHQMADLKRTLENISKTAAGT